MLRATFIGAGLPSQLWCFAYQYCMILLRSCWNRLIDNCPILLWEPTRKCINLSKLFIFGSKTYIVTENALKKQLAPRTLKDPRDYIGITVSKNALHQHFDRYFVGYGNHSGIILVWDPQTRQVKRAHHGYIDEYNVRVLENEPLTPNSVLLRQFPTNILDENAELDSTKVKIISTNIDIIPSKFKQSELAIITIQLPPGPSNILGLKLESDSSYGLPVLTSVFPTSPIRNQIPADLHHNFWIVEMRSDAIGFVLSLIHI